MPDSLTTSNSSRSQRPSSPLPPEERSLRTPGGGLAPEEMRAIGYRVVDMIVEHMTGLDSRPVGSSATRAEMETQLREPLPEQGISADALLDQVARDVMGRISHVDHPRFFAYVPSPGNFIGTMADALVSGFNPFAGAWKVAAGPAEVELVTIDWLRQICGMPDGAGGAFVSGGSMANLTAIAVARHQRLKESTLPPRIYTSDQTHSSVERGVGVLGFDRSAFCVLPSDEHGRLSIERLAAAVAEDRASGFLPFLVVANAGTTGTGAVDPIAELAELCRRERLWLHVDGAYGAAATLVARGKELLEGLGEADSITLDPHKWLFQPIECGCLLMRVGGMLRDTFRLVPAYLRDTDGADEEVNFRDHGIPMTRGFRALKLWMSLRYFGLAAFRDAIDHGLSLAEHAERNLASKSCWEITTPAQLAIVTFRYLPSDPDLSPDEVNRQISARLFDEGTALVSTTVVRGMTVLRLCTINPRTTVEDIERTIETMERLGRV